MGSASDQILNTWLCICEFWLCRITASCDGREFYTKNVQFKVLPLNLNTASCKGENWVNKEEKSQYWKYCYQAAFTVPLLPSLIYNLLYWAEKTVFIQSYPTKLWILTRKSFIEQNKMLVLSILTYLTPNTIYSKLKYQMALVLNLKWEWKSGILFDFIWRINMSKNGSVPWSSTVSQWV